MKIEHAYGTTTIPAKPTRIATVAWANHEVPLALGVAPVGMSKATWGDDDGDGGDLSPQPQQQLPQGDEPSVPHARPQYVPHAAVHTQELLPLKAQQHLENKTVA